MLLLLDVLHGEANGDALSVIMELLKRFDLSFVTSDYISGFLFRAINGSGKQDNSWEHGNF